MKSQEFLLLAIFCAVVNLSNPLTLLVVTGYVLALCGCWSSFREFAKAAGQGRRP